MAVGAKSPPELAPYKPWPVAVWWLIGIAVAALLGVFVGIPLLHSTRSNPDPYNWEPKVGATTCAAAGSGQICVHSELQHFGDGGIIFTEVAVTGLAPNRVVTVPGFTEMKGAQADQLRPDASGSGTFRSNARGAEPLTFSGTDAQGAPFTVTVTPPPLSG